MKACHLESALQQCRRDAGDVSRTCGVMDFFCLFVLQTKVGAAETRGSFEEVLSSAANASSQDTPTNNLTDGSERPC